MNIDHQIRQSRPLRPVGTGGGVEWTRGPCACPLWSVILLFHGTPTTPGGTRTGTRPPPIPSSTPCPYRRGADPFPVLVVNIHYRPLRLIAHKTIHTHRRIKEREGA